MVQYQSIVPLAILLVLTACGGQQSGAGEVVTDQRVIFDSAKVAVNNYADSISRDSIYQREAEMAWWSGLEFINTSVEYPFEPEDSIIGIGIVTPSESFDHYNDILYIYGDDNKVMVQVDEIANDIVTLYAKVAYDRFDTLNPLSPRLFSKNADYFSLAFDCIRTDNDFYYVLANRRTGVLLKIKKSDKNFKFQSIEEYAERWTGYGLDFDRSTNPLKKSPSDTSESFYHPKQKEYKVWSVKRDSLNGDWMHVHFEYTNETGWIRWRKGNQILIRMYSAC